MNSKALSSWFSLVAIILILWGAVFTVFGLGILPVDRDVLLEWETALYGAIMTGWGVTLLLAGRHAFQRGDRDLMKIIFYGLTIWLIIEAIFSAYLGVWFNVGVDLGVFLLFSYPLVKAVRSMPQVKRP